MQANSQKKNTVTFYIVVAVFLLVIFLLSILMLNVYPFLANIYHTTVTPAESNCDCIHHFPFLSNHPYLGMFILFISSLVAIFALYIVFNLLKNILITRRFIRKVISNKTKMSQPLRSMTSLLNLNRKVIAVDSNTYEVFCFGFFRPKICISSKLANKVSKSQLKAILLHEKNHLESHDPLKLFLVNTIKKSLFFTPGLKELINQFKIGLELAADEKATNNFQETNPLSKALLKIIESHQTSSNRSRYNVAVTSLNVTEARINQLLNRHKQPQFSWFIPKLVISIVIVIVLSVLLFNTSTLLAKTTSLNNADGNVNNFSCSMASDVNETSNNSSSCSFDTEAHMSCAFSNELNSCY